MESFTNEQLMVYFQENKDGRGAEALDQLYSRYAKRLTNFFFYSFNQDLEKAHDFVHDLFLKIMENKEKFDSNQSFQSWIFRIAANMCKNEFRSTQVNQKFKSQALNQQSQVYIQLEKDNTIKQQLAALEPEQRSLLILRFKFNLSVKEIASIFECPEGTVKSRLFYATKELSKNLKEYDYGK